MEGKTTNLTTLITEIFKANNNNINKQSNEDNITGQNKPINRTINIVRTRVQVFEVMFNQIELIKIDIIFKATVYRIHHKTNNLP